MMKIAKLANVSQATVSRVLNGCPGVSEDHVQSVKEAAKAINYKPRQKKNQTSKSSVTVAAITLSCDPIDRVFSTRSERFDRIEQELKDRDIQLLRFDLSNTDEIPLEITNGSVSGLILAGHHPNFKVLDMLEGYPKVWLNSRYEKEGDVVLPGNKDVGQLAVDYFIERNHKRIGLINAYFDNPAVVSRCAYFDILAKKAGVEIENYIYEDESGANKTTSTEELEARLEILVRKFVESQNKPTGLFVPIDLQVAIVYRLLLKYGVKIGKDVEILGCDNDMRFRVGLYPRPATIDIGAEVMLQQVVQLLIWRIQAPNVDRSISITVEPKLVEGES
ncbi:MAG: LacI family DNA-binding transcriptional regulator [Sedimentisphaeraceae bacterium JB056]